LIRLKRIDIEKLGFKAIVIKPKIKEATEN